jgi:hypothetical protein
MQWTSLSFLDPMLTFGSNWTTGITGIIERKDSGKRWCGLSAYAR